MWPMIAGLGSILGDGVAGYLVEPGPVRYAWGYDDGGAWLENADHKREVIARVKNPPGVVAPLPRVAVLMGPMTGSSGEAVALAFRGRPEVRFFGAPTAGVSSSNKGFALSDGSELVITTGLTIDREGKGDGGKLLPDAVVGPQETPTTQDAIRATLEDPVVSAAARWLAGS